MAGASEAQAQITIARTDKADVEQRQIVVKLDGERVGELMFGQSLDIPVTPGRHRLTVDNTWNWKTLDVNVTAGDHLRFQAVNRAGRLTWFLVSMLGAGPMYVSIEREA
jgi:hypothetical protein